MREGLMSIAKSLDEVRGKTSRIVKGDKVDISKKERNDISESFTYYLRRLKTIKDGLEIILRENKGRVK